MYSADSYQSIKSPSDLEDEQRYNAILTSLLEEFDPECGNYATFKQGCIRQAQRIMKERAWEEEEEENDQQFNLVVVNQVGSYLPSTRTVENIHTFTDC